MNTEGIQPSERELIHLKFDLPMPPGINKRWRPTIVRNPKTGKTEARMVRSTVAREWDAYAIQQVKFQRSGQWIPYRFEVWLWLPEAPTDSDAPIKETIDACQHGGAITDDKHCRAGHWLVDHGRPPRSMLVELKELPDPIPEALVKQISRKREQMVLGL